MLSDKKKAAVREAAQKWAGTPFRQHTEILGVGADCVHLARGVMVDAGFTVPPITIRNYPLDWARHRNNSLVVEWLEQSGVMVRQTTGVAVQAGDLLCIKLGRCAHHVALMVDGRQFIHTSRGRFAEYGIIDDPTYAHLLESIYRHVDAQ